MTINSTNGPQPPSSVSGQGFGLYINGEKYIFKLTGGTPPPAGTVWTLRTYGGPHPGQHAPGRYHAERIYSRDA